MAMDSPLFAIQLGIAVVVIVLIAVSTVRFGLRSTPTGAEPLVKANVQKLKPGWFQLNIAVANRAPYRLLVDELGRVRPKSARLMSPIQSVSTRKGDFQVWSDPTTDKAKISIPLDIAIEAHEPHQGGVKPASEAQISIWLYLPDGSDPTELELELAVFDGGDNLRAYRFGVMREVGPATHRQAKSASGRT
jgi:hypothetical protein